MDGPLANCGMDTGRSQKMYQSLVIEANEIDSLMMNNVVHNGEVN